MNTSNAPTDRTKRLIHFICGAFFGGAIGFGIYLFQFDQESSPLCAGVVGSGALILGTLSAVYLDRFWEKLGGLRDWFRALWPWPF